MRLPLWYVAQRTPKGWGSRVRPVHAATPEMAAYIAVTAWQLGPEGVAVRVVNPKGGAVIPFRTAVDPVLGVTVKPVDPEES